MPEPWRTLSIRIAIGTAFTWFACRQTGAVGLIFSAPVWGLLLARPVFEVLAAAHQRIKEAAWSEPGTERHAFGGHSLRVIHVGGYAWIVDIDLLSVLGEEPSKQSRRRADPARYAQLPDNSLWGYSEDGAIALLAAVLVAVFAFDLRCAPAGSATANTTTNDRPATDAQRTALRLFTWIIPLITFSFRLCELSIDNYGD